jgi:aryl-alcohol dehydrogenase-like predicted oxidoreductase
MLPLRLSQGDLSLSRVGLGCWTIGGTWWGPDQDDERAIRTIHAALDLGIDWLDTAPLYGLGHADELVNRALRGRPEVKVATKVGIRIGPGDHARSDLRPEYVRQDCAASLLRLGRSVIDLLQVHWPCESATPLEDTVGTLEDLRQEGHIRAWGLCNYGPEVLKHHHPASLQSPLSMLRREAEAELLPTAQAQNTPILAYEVLCRGLLAGRFRTPPHLPASDLRSRDPRFVGRAFAFARSLVDNLEKIGQKTGFSPAALAAGWALGRPGVGAVIVGARHPAQIQAAARAIEVPARPVLLNVLAKLVDQTGGLPPEALT